MKRQAVIATTFIITAFIVATLFIEVAHAQQPIASTDKILKTDNQNLRGQPYYPPYLPSPPPYYPPGPYPGPGPYPSPYPPH